MISTKRFVYAFKIFAIILLVWIVQVLFLYQASRVGFNGWDDWGMLFYYDAHRGSDLTNFFRNINDLGTPYIWTEVYLIGPLKDIFGLHQVTFKIIELLFKSLAAISAAYLVFKLTKDKLFAFFVIFFFIVFPSTVGVLSHVVLSGGFLTVAFMCLFALFYIQSFKEPKKVLFASLFFFLALLACPPRAYLILPIPLIVELVRLKRSFHPLIFLRRLIIFYFSLLFLQSNSGWFQPQLGLLIRLKQLTSGNLYTLSFPFQMFSTLFIDQKILQDIIGRNSLLQGFLILNITLIILTVSLGFVVSRKRIWLFVIRVMSFTILLESIFYFFGLLSSQNGRIPFVDLAGNTYFPELLNPTIFQASLGSYYFILGIVLGIEWWKNQRENKILKIIFFSWLWSISSELILYLTNTWWNMIEQSNDKYILACSVGAVIFAAGFCTLTFKALSRIKNLQLRLILTSLLTVSIIFIIWKDYKLLDNFYYVWNEPQGASSYWQETMYQKFLSKIGKESLKRPLILYFSPGYEISDMGSFGYPIRFEIYYDGKGNFIRDNCKMVIYDIDVLKKAYTVRNGEKGFMSDTPCVDVNFGVMGKTVFYPLSNFYAYEILNKEFIDIKNNTLVQLDQIDK